MINKMTLILILLISFLDGDVPRSTTYGVYNFTSYLFC